MRDPRIIAVNRFYWPDESATSQLLDDLVRHLTRRGEQVTVIASRAAGGANRGRALPARDCRDGVEIRRCWTSSLGRTSTLGRAVDYLTFYLSATRALWRETRAGDCILAKTDPPGLSVLAGLVARLRGARMVVWNQDVFPEIAEALGVVPRGGRLARAMRRLRNSSWRRATTNVAICPQMKRRLEAEGVAPDAVTVIPNWSDDALRPVARDQNPVREEWQLGDAFVIGYSGNLGRAHIAERVAELVRMTAGREGLVWQFVGSGTGHALLRALAEELPEGAIRFARHQPRERLPLSLSAPDLHLVSLAPDCEGLIMPSKLYGILAVGRPVLFLGDPNGAVAQEIERHGIGLTLDSARPETWQAAVDAFLSDRAALAEAGRRARALHEERYRAELSLDRWHAVLTGAAREPQPA